MNNDYFYLVTVDPYTMFSGRGSSCGNKYRTQLEDLFGDYAGCSSNRFAMTKDQLALFFYLRCRMGGQNGVKDLDMQRVRADRYPSVTVIDLRGNSGCNGTDEAPQPSAVELAQQLAKVDEHLETIATGGTITIGGLALNGDHMNKVLRVQRADIRAKLIAAISVPSS